MLQHRRIWVGWPYEKATADGSLGNVSTQRRRFNQFPTTEKRKLFEHRMEPICWTLCRVLGCTWQKHLQQSPNMNHLYPCLPTGQFRVHIACPIFCNSNNQKNWGSDKGVSPFSFTTAPCWSGYILWRLCQEDILRLPWFFLTSVRVEGSHGVMNLLRHTLNGAEAEEWACGSCAEMYICIYIYIYILHYCILRDIIYMFVLTTHILYTLKEKKTLTRIWVFFTLLPPQKKTNPRFFPSSCPRCKSRCTMFLEWMCILRDSLGGLDPSDSLTGLREWSEFSGRFHQVQVAIHPQSAKRRGKPLFHPYGLKFPLNWQLPKKNFPKIKDMEIVVPSGSDQTLDISRRAWFQGIEIAARS